MFCWVSEPGEQHRLCHLPAAGRDSPPAAFNISVRAEWHREKRGKEHGEDLCTASEIMCAFCSQPRHCFCLVCQKNICVLLFQSAHQQTSAQPLQCPCSPGFPLSEAVEMSPAVLWCSPLPWESRHCSAPEFLCTRSPLPSTSK